MISQIILHEGATEPIEDNLIDGNGDQIPLDPGTMEMKFQVIREGTNEVTFFKSSKDQSQIEFDIPEEGHYRIYREPEDTIGKAGNHVYQLTMTENGRIFNVKKGSLLIKGVNIA